MEHMIALLEVSSMCVQIATQPTRRELQLYTYAAHGGKSGCIATKVKALSARG